MEEKAIDLNNKISEICLNYMLKPKSDIISDITKIIPDINEFATYFLTNSTDKFMKDELMSSLNDIVQSMEQRDAVLMHDALDYGIKKCIESLINNIDKEVTV